MNELELEKRVTISGTVMYYENGVLSRPDGPAVVYIGGDEEWWANGKLHRHDPSTPNILYPAKSRWATMEFEYWIKGVLICRNPYHDNNIITDWEGTVVDGDTGEWYNTKFKLIRPKSKYKNMYPNKFKPVKFKIKNGRSGNCYSWFDISVTHRHGDEESGT